MRAANLPRNEKGRPEQAPGGGQGRVEPALTRVVPAQGGARQQKPEEAEKRTAASVGSGPSGRGHGAARRWCAAATHSRAGTGAVETPARRGPATPGAPAAEKG